MRHAAAERRGTSLIEVLVVLTILAVSVSIFSGMVVTTARQRAINRESAIASEGARRVLETMRNTTFRDIYALYNDRADDDPGGAGSAPGHRFAVDGLQSIGGADDGMVGQIYFVDAMVEVSGAPGSEPLSNGGATAAFELPMREDIPNAELGTPRDLNGDSIIDEEDHADDYVLLPVYVELRWDGVVGERRFRLHAMLTEFIGSDS